MRYNIHRDGIQFGPYTLEELIDGVRDGSLTLTDRAQNLETGEVTRLAKLVPPLEDEPAKAERDIPPPSVPQFGPQNQQANPPQSTTAQHFGLPMPPGVPWWGVALLSVITCSVFGIAWSFLQALWVKRIDTESRALLHLCLSVALTYGLFAALLAFGIARGLLGFTEEAEMPEAFGYIVLACLITGTVFYYAAQYSMKQSIEAATSSLGAHRVEFGSGFLLAVPLSAALGLSSILAPAWIQFKLDPLKRPFQPVSFY